MSTTTDRNSYRAVCVFDGMVMTQLAQLHAMYTLKCGLSVSRSRIIRRATDLLYQHIVALMAEPHGSAACQAEREAIREFRAMQPGLDGLTEERAEERRQHGQKVKDGLLRMDLADANDDDDEAGSQ